MSSAAFEPGAFAAYTRRLQPQYLRDIILCNELFQESGIRTYYLRRLHLKLKLAIPY